MNIMYSAKETDSPIEGYGFTLKLKWNPRVVTEVPNGDNEVVLLKKKYNDESKYYIIFIGDMK